MMDKTRKMNVLVLGNSGAGKSTLIKAISGAEVKTGTGGSVTSKIEVYESSTWPIRCIDTKGFEYTWLAQQKTISQVKKFTKQQIANETVEDGIEPGIDAVWYCVDGCAKRVFDENIHMMNKSIRGWKNVPIFAVITKSYSKPDIPDNIEAVKLAFAKGKSANLKAVIPVVAEIYRIDEDKEVPPQGIEELCLATLDCFDEAKNISKENRDRMILEQKRFTANAVVAGATTLAAVTGAVPIPFPDSMILVPLETALAKGVLKIYKIDFSGELITAIIGSTVITNVAKTALNALKAIPIAGAVLNAVVAGFFVGALGESFIALSESIYQGKIDNNEIEKIVDFISQKIKTNPVFGFAIKYLEENADKFIGKSPKEITKAINDAIKDGSKILKK